MFIQLYPNKAPVLKETIYYTHANLQVGKRDNNVQPVLNLHQTELVVSLAEQEFGHVQTHYGSQDHQSLVLRIIHGITSSLPTMTARQMQHAIFVKQLYLDGEIDFEQFLLKMCNLFPERMQTLPRPLLEAIAQQSSAE